MSNLFDEYVMERCEEIITKDEKCLNAIKEATKASKAFFNSLSPEQQKEYLGLESRMETRNSYQMLAVYQGARHDIKTG